MQKEKLVFFLLRLGLAFVFIYAAVASFMNPINWIGYFPAFMTRILPSNILLPFFSIYELLLAIWLIWGKKLFFSSGLASLTLAGIIIFNLSILDVVFRDVSIFFTAAALCLYSYEGKLKL